MSDPCRHCKIRKGCDWLSELCRLSPRQLITQRPDLIRPLTKHQRYYLANKDKYREWNREASKRYRERHRERRLQTERQWRSRHPESIARRQKEWWERNKSEINAERRRVRAEGKELR